MTEETEFRWILDSLEEDVAAVEVDGERVIFVPADLLPAEAREGDVLKVTMKRTKGRMDLEVVLDEEGKEELMRRSRAQNRRGRG
jgi:hypothetical protein